MLVAKRNRLLDRNVDACRIGRPINRVQSPAETNHHQCHRDQDQACKRVAAWLKYLRHTKEAEELRLAAQPHVISTPQYIGEQPQFDSARGVLSLGTTKGFVRGVRAKFAFSKP